MERAVALKVLRKLLGAKMGWRVDPRAATREEREKAAIDAKALTSEWQVVDSAREARRNEILQADAEYQRLKAEAVRLKKAKDAAWGRSHRYKITVGTVGSLFFSVAAQGDSWEEVIAALKAKAAA